MIRRRCSLKKYAWNTATGKSPLIINNSEKGKFGYFSIIGNTEQETTTGAQLFNKETRIIGKVIDNTNGNEGENDRYACSDFIEIPQGVKNLYQTNGALNQRAFYDKDKIFIRKVGTDKNAVIPENAKYIRITSTIDKTDMSNIMLNVGEIAKPFESYTGCKQSPSPEYPQEIKNVGKWNEEKQKYEVDVKVTGKILLNQELLKDESNFDKTIHPQGYWQYFIYLNPNTKYTVSRKNKDGYQTGRSIKISTVKNSTSGQWLMATHSASENKQSITLTTPDTGLISINFLVGNIDNVNEILKIAGYLQIECGETASDFESYKEPQTLTLTSDRPITKWDKLVEQDGQIGWLYKSCKKEFDGTEVFDERFLPSIIYSLSKKEYVKNAVLCNYADSNGIGCGNTVGTTLSFKKIADYWKCENAQQFKVFLKTKKDGGVPLCALWETVDTEFVPLTQSEQDAVKSLTTYSPTTVIQADGGEVIPNVEVIYSMEG